MALMALHCINVLLSGSWDLGLSFSGLVVCRFRQANEDKEWQFEVCRDKEWSFEVVWGYVWLDYYWLKS